MMVKCSSEAAGMIIGGRTGRDCVVGTSLEDGSAIESKGIIMEGVGVSKNSVLTAGALKSGRRDISNAGRFTFDGIVVEISEVNSGTLKSGRRDMSYIGWSTVDGGVVGISGGLR